MIAQSLAILNLLWRGTHSVLLQCLSVSLGHALNFLCRQNRDSAHEASCRYTTGAWLNVASSSPEHVLQFGPSFG